jgi:hypothetical protein
MLRDGAGDSLLSARTSGARRSMCGRDKGAFFGKAAVNGIQNCDANTTVCAPCKNNSDATKSAESCRIAGKPGIMSGRPQLPCGRRFRNRLARHNESTSPLLPIWGCSRNQHGGSAGTSRALNGTQPIMREKTTLALARVAPRILPHGDDQIEIESAPQYPWDSRSCPSGLSPFG